MVTALIASEVLLICSGNHDKLFCSFKNPMAKSYVLNSKFSSDEQGRITPASVNNLKDCGLLIARVKPDDWGLWGCNITAKYDGQYHVGDSEIHLRVVYKEEYKGNLPPRMQPL